jgi:hypothetical protein
LTIDVLETNKISLSWLDNAADNTGYRIESRLINGTTWKEFVSLGGNTTNYVYIAADATVRCYRVRAFALSGYSNVSTNQANESRIMILSWQDNSDNELEFRIERSTNGVSWTQIAVTPKNLTSYVDGNLTQGTLYFYRTRSTEFSDYSNENCPLPPPTNLHAINVCSDSITLEWDYPSNLISNTNFIVYRSLTGTGDWEVVGTVTNNPGLLLENK